MYNCVERKKDRENRILCKLRHFTIGGNNFCKFSNWHSLSCANGIMIKFRCHKTAVEFALVWSVILVNMHSILSLYFKTRARARASNHDDWRRRAKARAELTARQSGIQSKQLLDHRKKQSNIRSFFRMLLHSSCDFDFDF